MVARELDPLSEASEKVIHLSQVAHDVECFTWEGAQERSLAVQKYIQDSEATWANTLLFDHTFKALKVNRKAALNQGKIVGIRE